MRRDMEEKRRQEKARKKQQRKQVRSLPVSVLGCREMIFTKCLTSALASEERGGSWKRP
jgi:hypothetical protein